MQITMSARFFIIAILTNLGAEAYSSCNTDEAQQQAARGLRLCWNDWKLFKSDRVNTVYLADPSIMQEICGDGMIKDMDACITNKVDPSCNNVMVYWQGVKDKFQYICDKKDVFDRLLCRTNTELHDGIEACGTEHKDRMTKRADGCRSLCKLSDCLSAAFRNHCDDAESQYLEVVFDHELEVLKKYTCRRGYECVAARTTTRPKKISLVTTSATPWVLECIDCVEPDPVVNEEVVENKASKPSSSRVGGPLLVPLSLVSFSVYIVLV